MHTIKRILRGIAAAAITSALLLGMVGCATGAQSQGNAASSARAETATQTAQTTQADLDTSWNETTSTIISLNGDAIAVDGSGAVANGSIVTISAAGTYVVSGTLTDGQIVIKAGKDDEVRLVLNGADITNRTGAPIYAAKCKLILTLADGTVNTVTDGGAGFAYALVADEEPNAAIFSKDDLTINGGGALTVNAGFNNGIGSKDNLLIVSGDLTVSAANHGLRGNDSVTVLGGTLRITAGNDGIQTNNADEADMGRILIEGGALTIESAHDGMQADSMLTVTGGTIDITAGGGVAKTQTVASSDTTSESYKGLKASGDVAIGGGTIVVNSYDDCVHSNGSVLISGGALTLSTADDGVHADGDLTITGGSISVKASYEGLEAANITITDGVIDVVSSDDGINAAGGSDQGVFGGRFGRDQFASAGNYSITISGGQVAINAGGDGIDSNGSLTISGGTVVSIINSTPDNGGLDCDGTLTLSGGTVIYGGTGTGNSPGSGSTQSYVLISSGVAAGNEVTVRQNGSTLITFTPASNCQYLALSSPAIIAGQSYEVYSGASLLATVTAGTGGSGMGGPGGGGGGGQGRPRGW